MSIFALKYEQLNFEHFITSHLTKRESKLSGPVIRIAVMAVSVSILVMLLTLAIVTGFKQEVSNKVIGFGAHLQITAFDNVNSVEMKPISINTQFQNDLKATPGVSHIQPYITKAGIIRTDEETHGVVLKGVDSSYNWKFFETSLKAGTLPKYSNSSRSNSALISSEVAKKLNLALGDALRIYFIPQTGTIARARKLDIVGIYETGLSEFDDHIVICDIQHLAKLNDWENGEVTGYEILIDDFNQLPEMERAIYDNLPYTLTVQSIKSAYPQIFEWLELQNINVTILITLMIIISIITMISTLLVLILEQISMIGILKALGAHSTSIRKIFIYQAIHIIFRGIIWGNSIGLILCFLQAKFHILKLPQESYFMSFVPIQLQFSHFLIINIATVIICASVLILPTLIITKISPIQTIRYE